jgi:hypothetical protein
MKQVNTDLSDKDNAKMYKPFSPLLLRTRHVKLRVCVCVCVRAVSTLYASKGGKKRKKKKNSRKGPEMLQV